MHNAYRLVRAAVDEIAPASTGSWSGSLTLQVLARATADAPQVSRFEARATRFTSPGTRLDESA